VDFCKGHQFLSAAQQGQNNTVQTEAFYAPIIPSWGGNSTPLEVHCDFS